MAIDIGGTKTLIAYLSDKGQIIQSLQFPTPQDYQQFLKGLSENLQKIGPIADLKGCCMGIPGHIDRETGVVFALGNLPWRDKLIRDDVAKILNGIQVIIENDARLAGLSEAQLLNNQYQDVLFLTISTGIGGAFIQKGKIVQALQDTEMGKMPLSYKAEFVHWEDFAGGHAIVERFGKRAEEITDPAMWRQIGENLAYGLGAVCSVLQPEAIILGGSVGPYADNFIAIIKHFLEQNLHPVVRQPKAIMRAKRPAQAVLYGCYELLKQMSN